MDCKVIYPQANSTLYVSLFSRLVLKTKHLDKSINQQAYPIQISPFPQQAQRVSLAQKIWTPGLLNQEGADAEYYCMSQQWACGIAVVALFSVFVSDSVSESG